MLASFLHKLSLNTLEGAKKEKKMENMYNRGLIYLTEEIEPFHNFQYFMVMESEVEEKYEVIRVFLLLPSFFFSF